MTSASGVLSHEVSWRDEIRQLEEEGCTAFLAQDLDRLRQFWSADLAVNSPVNRIHTRDQVLDLLGRGIIRHVSMELQFAEGWRWRRGPFWRGSSRGWAAAVSRWLSEIDRTAAETVSLSPESPTP